jgi:hypothetical protein
MPNPPHSPEMRTAGIGVFDSGFGGLTVLSALRKRLPQYDYVYLGDSARVPYGNRSHEIVYEFTREGVFELFARGCTVVVLACNTASARALRRIQQADLPRSAPDRRVLGVVRPSAEALAGLPPGAIPGVTEPALVTGTVAVLGTPGTVASNSYGLELAKPARRKAQARSTSSRSISTRCSRTALSRHRASCSAARITRCSSKAFASTFRRASRCFLKAPSWPNGWRTGSRATRKWKHASATEAVTRSSRRTTRAGSAPSASACSASPAIPGRSGYRPFRSTRPKPALDTDDTPLRTLGRAPATL